MFNRKTAAGMTFPSAANTATSAKTGRAKGVAMLATVAVGVTALVLGGATTAVAAEGSGTTYVSQSDIGSTNPTGSNSSWYADLSGGGTTTVTTDAFDGQSSLKLGADTSSAQARLLLRAGPDLMATQTNLNDFLAGASYSYSGAAVQFAVELYFTPTDEALYGPTGSSPCTQATDTSGSAIAGECYTTLEWNPFASSSSAWTTVDLTATTAANSGTNPSTGGWLNSNRIGEYAKPGALIGDTLDEYLAQMANYQILSGGVQIGSGSTGSGWVKYLKFNGAAYAFGTEPTEQTSTTPPAASDSSLDQLIADDNIDVTADAAQLTPTGATNSNLAAVDASQPLSGTYAWQDPTDAFVNVYTYSSPIFVGTFPVVNGNIAFSTGSLAQLATGQHHLVFSGQTSGTLAVVPFTITTAAITSPAGASGSVSTASTGTSTAASLAYTGTADAVPAAIIAALLLLAGIALRFVRRGTLRRNV
jgi:hypothetical protein